MNLQQAFERTWVWRGRDHGFHHAQAQAAEGLPTGHPELDAQLPMGGWPVGALTEILFNHPGTGELRLLLPSLRRLTQAQQRVALLDPPWIPYAPALAAAGVDLAQVICIGPLDPADRLWALEQTLRAGHCRAVLAWPEPALPTKALRRLQLAAETGQVGGFLLRGSEVREQHSPAALRIQLLPSPPGTHRLDILKCRGRQFTRPLRLDADRCLAA